MHQYVGQLHGKPLTDQIRTDPVRRPRNTRGITDVYAAAVRHRNVEHDIPYPPIRPVLDYQLRFTVLGAGDKTDPVGYVLSLGPDSLLTLCPLRCLLRPVGLDRRRVSRSLILRIEFARHHPGASAGDYSRD